MSGAIQLVTGFFTAAGAGTNIVTPSIGDSTAIPNFDKSNPAYLEQLWATNTADDWVRWRTARGHDIAQGIRLQVAGLARQPLLPMELEQGVWPADTPFIEIDATGAGSDALSLLYYYTDYPSIDQRLASWADISSRIKSVTAVDVLVSACAAIGQYSPGVTINSAFDNFEADADYALLGYVVASPVLSIAVFGQDTGNLKVGGPGYQSAPLTYDWFVRLSEQTGRPCIPLIAANNKGSPQVLQVDNTAHAAQHVSLIMAQLG
jgi:hypothetical protein